MSGKRTRYASHGSRVLPLVASCILTAACSPAESVPNGQSQAGAGAGGASGASAGGIAGGGVGGAGGVTSSGGSGGSGGGAGSEPSGGSSSLAGSGGSDAAGAGSGSGGTLGGGGNAGSSAAAGSGGVGGSAGSIVAGGAGAGGQGGRSLPDPGPEGDGEFTVGPSYTSDPDLGDRGAPKGRNFQFSMRLADSDIFDGTDATLDPSKPVNATRTISVYVPAEYEDGTPAPLIVIQDGPGELSMVRNALDNLTITSNVMRRLPAFVAVAVQNGGNNSKGSERGLEYDTLSDRYARFIHSEVLPAVEANTSIKQAYPNFKLTQDPYGRAALGCSSGGAAALTMGWFRPDYFSRLVTYSGTFTDQQDDDAPEEATYPLGAWEYHSSKSLIANAPKKELRVFLNANESDLGASEPESTHQNWLMANQRTAAALQAKGYHYRYVFGRGVGHCDARVISATLADALIWVWRGYQASGN